MRILFVVEAALGGTGEVVLELAGALVDNGHDVGLLYSAHRMDPRFRRGKDELERRGARVVEAPLHPYRGPRGLAASISAVRREAARHDVAHLHGAWAGLVGRMAVSPRRRPVLYSPHGGSLHPGRGGVYRAGRAAERLLARRTTAFVVSSAYEESLLRSVIRSPTRVRLIRHGRPGVPSGDTRSPRPGPRFGVVGRIVPEKRLDVAVDALKLVRRRLPDAELVVVGEGPWQDELGRRVASAGLSDAVRIAGFVGEKPEIYGSFDVLLLPSDSEAAPLVVAEAQAFAIPAVVAASGGGELAVDDGVNGLIVPRGDVTKMAEAMMIVAGTTEAYERFSRAAREAMENHPTWREVAEGYVALYEEVAT